MEKSKGEKIWVFIWRILGTLIGFAPFIRNLLWHFGISDEKYPLTWSDGVFIIVGFIFVWGSNNFGSWANELGKTAIEKIKK